MITKYMIIFMWAFSKVSYGQIIKNNNRNSTGCCRTIEISSTTDESNYYHNHGTFTTYLHNYTYLSIIHI